MHAGSDTDDSAGKANRPQRPRESGVYSRKGCMFTLAHLVNTISGSRDLCWHRDEYSRMRDTDRFCHGTESEALAMGGIMMNVAKSERK